jgi:hypothetical protein
MRGFPSFSPEREKDAAPAIVCLHQLTGLINTEKYFQNLEPLAKYPAHSDF